LPAHLELNPAWQDMKTQIRRTVGDSTYDVWFEPLEVKAWDGSVLVIQGKPGTDRFMADRFGRVLERCARSVFGGSTKVAFAGDPAVRARDALAAAGADHADRLLKDQPFVPRYTFDQFIIGDGNRLAHAAALAVAEAPSQTYNPLFLHAPPGLGKTHLLHAIGNYIAGYEQGAIVRYTTVEAFTNDFIAALNGRALDRFKHLYREVDVLLIDDVQFLASKAKTEEEFFHTFNALYDSGRQLVLTCDRLPSQLTGIEQRLRERFEAGLVAHLSAPDRATRVAILRKRAAIDGIKLPDQDVFELIADRITDNVRSLEGALIRIVANHSLTGRPLNAGLALTILDEMHPLTATNAGSGAVTVQRIQHVVAEYYGISTADLVSQSRASKVSRPRQLAIYLSRELTDTPLQRIGDAFGGRNHATVLHACKRVGERISSSDEDSADLQQLLEKLGAGRTRPRLLTD
jgi:chromosomal replication initiator protein